VNEYDASAFRSPEKTDFQEFDVVRYSVYPNFKSRRLSDNIAILHLSKSIDLVSYNGINAACLPPCTGMFDGQFRNGTGVRCWVAGWGRDRKNGDFQAIQHKVDVPIFDRRRCQNSLKRALQAVRHSTANTFKLHSSELCAGGETGKDACDGDGGAPLVCQAKSGHW